MRKFGYLILFFGICNVAISQKTIGKPSVSSDTLSPSIDSLQLKDELNSNLSDNIPVISIDENGTGNFGTQNIASSLSAGRDPFLYSSSFNFFAARFRVRGYQGNSSNIYINGVPIENLQNGTGSISALSGLSFILRNRDYSLGLRPLTYGYGGIGTNVNIDARPSNLRKSTVFGYAYSNRIATHRYSFTYSSGLSKKGWAYVFSGSRRWSDEGYVPGTYTNSWSYYLGIDKKISEKRTISLSIFGAPGETGSQSRGVVNEIDTMLNTHYYNPNWGYQNAKKRNAAVVKTNQPTIILSDETKFNNHSSLINAASLSFGNRGTTSLDYFNSPSPDPTYYQYLPSYYLNQKLSSYNPVVANYIDQQWKTDVNTRQINWQRLYDVNKNNRETISNATVNSLTGQTYTGNRSSYVLGESVTNSQKINFSSTYNTRFSNRINFTIGSVFKSQNDHIYRKLDDLLGGNYYVDLNDYAFGSFPSNPLVQYPNLKTPNNIVRVGDTYQHNYNAHIIKSEIWTQAVYKLNQFDLFAAAQVSNTQLWRVGNWQSGLYPNNSFGKSTIYSFNNYALKGGITYKVNGKNYLYLNGAYLTKAPDFRNIFLSPNTRDQVQNNIVSEKTANVEGGVIVNTPTLRLKLNGFYTSYKDQMNVISFFNQDVHSLTNYAMNNISKVHFGTELGFEKKITPELTLLGAASVGRYYYDSRQYATVVIDNTQGIFANDTVYSKNYRVPNTPQEAYSLGLQYRSKKYWYISITGNYFNQMWSGFNPVRLTSGAVSNADYHSAKWYHIINQEELPSEFMMNISGGKSWKLPRDWFGRVSFLSLNGNISNLLDNKNLVNYAGQQLRFNPSAPDEFPSKYTYAEGRTYSVSATLRF